MKYFCYLTSPFFLLLFIVSIAFSSCIDDSTFDQIQQENCIGEYNDQIQQTYTITPDFSTSSLCYKISVSGDQFSAEPLGEILSTDDGSIQEISNKEIFFTPDANAQPPYKFDICKSGSHTISIGKWNKITDSLFIPARGAQMVVDGKQLYIYGGFDGTNYRADLHRYDLTTGTSTVLNAGYPERAYHGMSLNNNKLYVYGGYSTGAVKLNDTQIYDITTNTWANANPTVSPIDPRYYVATSASSTDMYVVGGYVSPSIINEIWVYNYSGNSWTLLDSSGPARRNHTVVQSGDSIYLFGGYEPVSTLTSQLYKFSITSKIWTQIGDLTDISSTYSDRAFHAFFYYNNALYVFGGRSGSVYLNDLYKFDLTTEQWVEMESGATPRIMSVFATLDNYGLIVGSGSNYLDGAFTYLNDLWIYDPKGD
ncbi:MAG: hypothetical protein CVV49_11750 [Spirochaetae bacterium HGW-Spirochaetae-5]|nr:MAG: hypothetical protein CVV49_11750 [Spirochaetae bacterium HGW-Spirochaetae-5]